MLAVEQGLAETANHVTKDTIKNLSERKTLFEGLVKEHVVLDENLQHLKQATEYKEVQSTVDEQVDYLSVELAKYYNVLFLKETGNQNAKADIVVDEHIVAKDVPSIVLLGMEKKLNSLLAVYNALPTLDAAKSWVVDTSASKKGIYKTEHQEERQHTVTGKQWKEISPATKEHPAQLKEVETTTLVGKYVISSYSGAVTSQDKAERIQRLTNLIRAVKEARQRANNTEVEKSTDFGNKLMNYINGIK